MLLRAPQLCHLIFGHLFFAASSDAQWIYPPPIPSGTTLSDFASGALTSNLTYAVHDTILGSFEPSNVDLYILYRCTHSPTTTPIYPSNLTISSAEGTLAADGTWEYPWTYLSWAYSNAFSPGQDLLFFASFQAPNATVGSLCWFELSTGTDETNPEPPFNRSISLNGGDFAHHFTTTPFNVVPARATNTTWTINGNASESGQGSPSFTLSFGSQPTATGGGAQPSATHSGAGAAYTWYQISLYDIKFLWAAFLPTFILIW